MVGCQPRRRQRPINYSLRLLCIVYPEVQCSSEIACCRGWYVLWSSTNKNNDASTRSTAVPSNRSFCGFGTEVRLRSNNHNRNFHRHHSSPTSFLLFWFGENQPMFASYCVIFEIILELWWYHANWTGEKTTFVHHFVTTSYFFRGWRAGGIRQFSEKYFASKWRA